MDTIEVLIADDDRTIRETLAELVATQPHMRVVAIAGNAGEAAEVAGRLRPHVAIVDVKMGRGGGPSAARGISSRSPATRVIAFSAHMDRASVFEMVRAGAVGYLVKDAGAEEILAAIEKTAGGESVLSSHVTGDVLRELAEQLRRSEAIADELRKLDATKSELIQVLSHELLTPITVVQGAALTLVNHGDRLDADQLQALARGVDRASTRLRRLVNNLTTTARLDQQGVQVSCRPLDLGEIVTAAKAELRDDGGPRITGLPDARLGITVLADPEFAGLAVAIVLENAIAFSEGSDVQLDVAARDDDVELLVSDHGPGIPAELREHVFEALTQVDSSTTRVHQGLGLGLYLARRIMTSMGGAIEARSRTGGGSTFALTFPRVERGAKVEPSFDAEGSPTG